MNENRMVWKSEGSEAITSHLPTPWVSPSKRPLNTFRHIDAEHPERAVTAAKQVGGQFFSSYNPSPSVADHCRDQNRVGNCLWLCTFPHCGSI